MNFHDPPSNASGSAAEPGASGAAVQVRLFSVLREAVGQAQVRVALDEPISGAALLDRLAEEHPVLARHRQAVRLAVGERYASEDATVRPGDEVALITPVSGG